MTFIDGIILAAQVGIVAGIGWWIDLALEDNEEKALRRWLDDWWTAFDNLKLPNFGQEEAKAVVTLFDAYLGSRFFEWKRWRAVILICLVGEAIGIADTLVDFRNYLDLRKLSFGDVPLIIEPLSVVSLEAVILCGVALSLSVTRAASVRVSKLSGAKSAIGFAGLLVLSVVIFVIFRNSVDQIRMNSLLWFQGDILRDFVFRRPSSLEDVFSDPAFMLVPDSGLFRLFLVYDWPSGALGGVVPVSAIHSGGRVVDLITNGARIVFAAVFVVSFLFRRLVHRPLSRLGFVALTSGKPVFALTFGVASFVILGVDKLSSVP